MLMKLRRILTNYFLFFFPFFADDCGMKTRNVKET